MNVKPGQLATITAGPNAGTLVEVLSWHGTHLGYHDFWNVRTLSGAMIVQGPRRGERVLSGTEAIVRDAHLRPLPDDPDATEEHDAAPTDKVVQPA